MKYWSLVGILVVLGSIVPLVLLRETRAASTPAATWMIGFGVELERYSSNHEGRYPPSFGELILDGAAVHAANPVDPWDQRYIYERHPNDPRLCRVYTLGDPRRAERADNGSTLALYRIGSMTMWRERLEEVPYPWRAADALPDLPDH